MTPDEYCQDKAAKSGSSFYYSFLFLPEPQRKAIIALYAFCREVDDVVDEISDSNIAAIKLQWWRDEISRTFQGQPNHPVGLALLTPIKNYSLPEEHFQEIIDGMEMDLKQSCYASYKELSLYCYRVASVVGLLSIEIFGYENKQTRKFAHSLGLAFQLTNILRDIKEDAERGRFYLPEEAMTKHGVSREDILSANNHSGMQALLTELAQQAKQYYLQAFELLPEEDRYAQRTAIIMAAIYQATLDEIIKENYPVLERRVRLSAPKKLWMAWRTARQEKRRQHIYQKAQIKKAS